MNPWQCLWEGSNSRSGHQAKASKHGNPRYHSSTASRRHTGHMSSPGNVRSEQ